MDASSRNSGGSTWTAKQNKLFERALVAYEENTPNRWQKVARAVGGKSADDVKLHYDILLQDLNHIDSGHVPLPHYYSPANPPKTGSRTKYPKPN